MLVFVSMGVEGALGLVLVLVVINLGREVVADKARALNSVLDNCNNNNNKKAIGIADKQASRGESQPTATQKSRAKRTRDFPCSPILVTRAKQISTISGKTYRGACQQSWRA